MVRVACPVSADGPSYATIFSTPVNYQGILPAEVGSQVKMECFSDGRLQVEYRWIHNISVLSFSEKNITLPSLTWDQMGRYRCIVENSATHEVLYDEVQVQTHVLSECSSYPLLSPNPTTLMPLPRQYLSSEMPSSLCVAILTMARSSPRLPGPSPNCLLYETPGVLRSELE